MNYSDGTPDYDDNGSIPEEDINALLSRLRPLIDSEDSSVCCELPNSDELNNQPEYIRLEVLRLQQKCRELGELV